MNQYHLLLETCIQNVEKLRQFLKKDKSVQIRSIDEKSLIKATAFTWFRTQRISLIEIIGDDSLQSIDELFNSLLALSDKNCSRKKADNILKQAKTALTQFRSEKIALLSKDPEYNSNNEFPKFSLLVSDLKMIEILERRWKECIVCVTMNAPLAAIVMMGGLLESLLMSRFLQETDKNLIFKTKAVPKDKAGTALQLNGWMLKDYIDVAHELKWISQTEKDLGVVLRDYRNYIHPSKEKSHGVVLLPKDASIMWEVSKNICRQIVNYTP